jgi:hypothetical protein
MDIVCNLREELRTTIELVDEPAIRSMWLVAGRAEVVTDGVSLTGDLFGERRPERVRRRGRESVDENIKTTKDCWNDAAAR